jgi:hypothetical protein
MRENQRKTLRMRIGPLVLSILLLDMMGNLFLPARPPGYLIFTMLLGVLILILCEWSLRFFHSRNSIATLIHRHMTLIVFLFVAVLYSAGSVLLDAKHRYETRQMTWSNVKPSARFPQAKLVVLRDIDDPERFILIISQDLGDYLESLPENRVPVVFETPTNTKEVKLPKEVQIGELKKWDVQFRMEGKGAQSFIENVPW